MDSDKVDQLVTQMTRIADALQLQQELKLKELAQGSSEGGTCKSLIQAANRMGRSLNEVSTSVDSVNGGRIQSTEATVASVARTMERNAESQRELENAMSALSARSPAVMVDDIVQGLGVRGVPMTQARRAQLDAIEKSARKAK